MSNLTTVRLIVNEFGDDPAVVTSLIGFAPTGTAALGWSSLPQQTSWFAEMPEPVPDKLEDRVAALVGALEQHADGVRRVAGMFHARIEISLDDRAWIGPHDPGSFRSGHFEISPEVTAAASRLGLGIAIHLTSGWGRREK